MDLSVADVSIASLLRRVGDSASPLSARALSSPRQREPARRRRSSVVRAAILRRGAGERRSPAGSRLQQFIRDQEVAFDRTADSVSLNDSDSPTTRARSFLAHQRRSLPGDELATLLRELRESPQRAGRRRLSVGVSQRRLNALGDEGVQALLGLVDDGLEEFEGTMSASVEEEETLTSIAASQSAEGGPSAAGTPVVAEPGVEGADEDESGGEDGDDNREEGLDVADEEYEGDDANIEEEANEEADADVGKEINPEEVPDMEEDFNEEKDPDVEVDMYEQEASDRSGEINRSFASASRGRDLSPSASARSPKPQDRSGTPTVRAPLRSRTPSSANRRGTPAADMAGTPSSRDRSRPLSRSRDDSATPSAGAASGPPSPSDRRGTPTDRSGGPSAGDRNGMSRSRNRSGTPSIRAPLHGGTPLAADGSRASDRQDKSTTPADGALSRSETPSARDRSGMSRSGLSGTPSAGATLRSGTPLTASRRGTPTATDTSGGPSVADRSRVSRSRLSGTPSAGATLHSGTPLTASRRGTPTATDTSGGPSAADRSRVSRSGLSGTPSAGATRRSGTPLAAEGSRASDRQDKSTTPADAALSRSGTPSARESSGVFRTPRARRDRPASARGPVPEEVQEDEDRETDVVDGDTGFSTPLPPPEIRESGSHAATDRARTSVSTPQPKSTPRSGPSGKRTRPVFDKFLADTTRMGMARTSTPMSEPPRRAAGAARSSPHSKSMYVAAYSPRGGRPASGTLHRLSLVPDEDALPAPRFTSGLIDDPDERDSDASDVSDAFPAQAAGTPRPRSGASGRVSALSGGSRAGGTPFVPSAESTRLSLRPSGAPQTRPTAGADSDTSDTVVINRPAAGGSSADAGSRHDSPRSAGSSPGAAADRSGASAGTPSKRRSLRTSFADGSTPGQEEPAAAVPGGSRSQSGRAATPRAPARKPSVQEAFARLFPNYDRDQQQQREAAAAARQRSARKPATKRSSLFGSHKTSRWFKRSAVGLRVTPEALREVDASVEKFEHMVRGWLRQVAGPHREPTRGDVLAVLRRSGIAGTEAELRRLVRRHMPMEEQQQLIRVTESGGRLYPAQNPLAEF